MTVTLNLQMKLEVRDQIDLSIRHHRQELSNHPKGDHPMSQHSQNYHLRKDLIREPLQVKNTIYLSIVISQLKIHRNRHL